MLRAAMTDDEHAHFELGTPYPLSIETLEIDQPQASYTIDTLRTLRARLPDSPLVWIMGSDQLRNLTTWRDWVHLLDLAHIAVVQRAGAEVMAADLPAPLNERYAECLCVDDGWRESLHGCFIPFEFAPIAYHPATFAVRRLQRDKRPIHSVRCRLRFAHYITQHQLYVTSP